VNYNLFLFENKLATLIKIQTTIKIIIYFVAIIDLNHRKF